MGDPTDREESSTKELVAPAPPPAYILAQPSARTLSELVPVFLNHSALIRQRAEETVRAYQSDLAAFLKFCVDAGLVYPDDVRAQHIEFHMGVLLKKHSLKPSTVNRHLSALRSFWEWMQHEEITLKDPAARAYCLKQPKRLPKYLPIPQQDRLFSALSQDHSTVGVRDYAIHATLGLGGLRCSELSNLRLANLDLESGVIHVIGKGDKERLVPIVDLLAAILSRYLIDARPALLAGRSSEYVFVRVGTWGWKHEGLPLERRSIFRIVRKTLKRVLGIEKGHPHMLRHSLGHRVREHGGSPQDLQEILGHANIATTARYSQLLSSSQRARFAELVSGPAHSGGAKGKRKVGHRPVAKSPAVGADDEGSSPPAPAAPINSVWVRRGSRVFLARTRPRKGHEG